MKKILLLLLAASLLPQCTTYHRVRSNNLVTKATLAEKHFYQEIPFTLAHGLPVVPVYIGQDSTPYSFCFDTGGYTVLSEELKERAAGVHQKSYIDVKDANNQTARIHTYMLDELSVGPVPFENVGFARIGFTEAEYFSCPGIAGTVGPGVMKECIWYFDYDNQKIVATDQLEKIPNIGSATRIPIKTNNINKPLMEFTVEGQKGVFTFDTGDNGFIGFRKPFIESLGRNFPSATRYGQGIRAGHSQVREDVTLHRLDSIRLGGSILLENVIGTSRNSSAHSLGAGIFDFFNVVFNLGKDEVYFIRRKKPAPGSTLYSFGFGIDFKDQKLVVGHLYNNSPASRAGIQVGDELAKIDGRRYEFSDYCDFLNNFNPVPEERIELELVRDGQGFAVELKKERIL
ncbi:MAG: aspartyl protease family protein [Phaeodactylibacter sp.]|nr:aspartyl protease family protein [Phaeodactylibacter sp.]MCB9291470.1 aspartyl protease family protein [Lewinellaceae bacterium]